MTTDLGPALHELTQDQPLQPADRIGSVTRRARRIRRTRIAVSVAAVLAVAAPVGLLLQPPSDDRSARYAARNAASWPERSPAQGRGVAQGALIQWVRDNHQAGNVHWLYRGAVDVPGGAPLYVAAWVADGRAVVGFIERGKVDSAGTATDAAWQLKDVRVDSADHLAVYLPRLEAGGFDEDNYVFLLADPRARSLRWQATPLPFSPTGPEIRTAGRLSSRNGVFRGWTGSVTGPLRVSFDELTSAPAPLATGGDYPQLVRVATPDVPNASPEHPGISAGAGQLDADNRSVGYGDESSSGPATIYVRCYGGGRLTVRVDELPAAPGDHAVGSVPCDTTTGTVTLPASKGRLLYLRGDRFQVFAFAITGP